MASNSGNGEAILFSLTVFCWVNPYLCLAFAAGEQCAQQSP